MKTGMTTNTMRHRNSHLKISIFLACFILGTGVMYLQAGTVSLGEKTTTGKTLEAQPAHASDLAGAVRANPQEELTHRDFSSAWSDKRGNVWIFGGYGKDASGITGLMNDLWHWNGKNWRRISGSPQSGASGVYSASQTPLTPGARIIPETWLDEEGNLWLSGGYGRDEQSAIGMLNDLWKWDGTRWHWVSGSKLRVQTNKGRK